MPRARHGIPRLPSVGYAGSRAGGARARIRRGKAASGDGAARDARATWGKASGKARKRGGEYAGACVLVVPRERAGRSGNRRGCRGPEDAAAVVRVPRLLLFRSRVVLGRGRVARMRWPCRSRARRTATGNERALGRFSFFYYLRSCDDDKRRGTVGVAASPVSFQPDIILGWRAKPVCRRDHTHTCTRDPDGHPHPPPSDQNNKQASACVTATPTDLDRLALGLPIT